jgi:DNA mismatch endonuclease (patch repair protein)
MITKRIVPKTSLSSVSPARPNPMKESPPASSPEVARRMRNVRRRDTAPELRLRSELRRRGFRFRIDASVPFLVRHRADILVRPARVAVFVDGCFWHGCPLHGVLPKSNSAWWCVKLEGVRLCDRRTDAAYEANGWTVLRFWEHHNVDSAADVVQEAVLAARRTSHQTPLISKRRVARQTSTATALG